MPADRPIRRPLYYRLTHGIRVSVRPVYLAERSEPSLGRWVFAYYVRIENVGDRAARLVSRRWLIHDSIGEVSEVAGDGVVGEQPMLAPGQIHEYQSFCVLKSPEGAMEGAYRFVCGDGSGFDAAIPRFDLQAAEA